MNKSKTPTLAAAKATTETDIQNDIRIKLSDYGIVIRQNTGIFLTPDGRHVKCGVTGLSDLLFVGDGYVAFIEVKKPGGTIRKEQKNFIRRMRQLHHKAGIAYSTEDAFKIAGIPMSRPVVKLADNGAAIPDA